LKPHHGIANPSWVDDFANRDVCTVGKPNPHVSFYLEFQQIFLFLDEFFFYYSLQKLTCKNLPISKQLSCHSDFCKLKKTIKNKNV
jgi:hypothetical protein